MYVPEAPEIQRHLAVTPYTNSLYYNTQHCPLYCASTPMHFQKYMLMYIRTYIHKHNIHTYIMLTHNIDDTCIHMYYTPITACMCNIGDFA